MTDRARNVADRMSAIMRTLDRSAKVRRYDRPCEKQAEAVALGLLDISSELEKLAKSYLPALEVGQLTDEELDDVLIEIQVSLGHIHYHLKDMKMFTYLPEAEDE